MKERLLKDRNYILFSYRYRQSNKNLYIRERKKKCNNLFITIYIGEIFIHMILTESMHNINNTLQNKQN